MLTLDQVKAILPKPIVTKGVQGITKEMQSKYTPEFRRKAMKEAKEFGVKKTAEKFKIPYNTLSGWLYKKRVGINY